MASAIRGSRVGAGPMGEAERGESIARFRVSYWCANGHETKPSFAEDGTVEVLDNNGTPRYNDSGDLLSVNEMVSEFLTANPHHVRASKGGTGSQGNAGGSTLKPQSTVNDMVDNWNDGGREAYRALMKAKK